MFLNTFDKLYAWHDLVEIAQHANKSKQQQWSINDFPLLLS